MNNGQGNGNRRNIKCLNCGIEGHYSNQCTKISKKDEDGMAGDEDEVKGMAICTTVVQFHET